MLAFFALRGGGYGPEKRKNKAIPCELESMWFVLRWVSREREARGRTSHLDASYARSSFPSHPMLHYGRVCACIPRRDIPPSNSAGSFSSPSRLCAAPSLRVPRTRLQRYSLCSRLRPTRPMSPRRPAQSTRSVLSPIVRPTPLTRPWPVEPPTVPFPIIPIDISSTWVCPWCFVGTTPTGVAFRQSHVRHRAGPSRRDVPRETIHRIAVRQRNKCFT